MGWNGYNYLHGTVTAAVVEAQAKALVDSGMTALGYDYVNLDGGWALPKRSAAGTLQPDPAKFPQGIRPLAAYVHSLGLKFGIYTSAGTENCAGTSAGSYGHYWQDIATFASWDVDYLKLDWCYVPYWAYPWMSTTQLNRELAIEMGNALLDSPRPIVYDVNDRNPTSPSVWTGSGANLWRTAPDIQDTYASFLTNFQRNVLLYRYAGPQGWNDPDMLEVGNGGMSVTEYQSEFSLWAEMAAPLIAGTDLTAMSPSTLSILTNRGVIAVDQDRAGHQAHVVSSPGGQWILVRTLANGDRALVFFNQNSSSELMSTTLGQIGLKQGSAYSLLDLWAGTKTVTNGVIAASVPSHGVVMYRISPG